MLAALLLGAGAVADERDVVLEFGLGGFAKRGHWFPVTVRAGPGAARFEVDVAAPDGSSGELQPVFRSAGSFPDGAPSRTTLCKADRRAGRPALLCRVFYADGAVRQTSASPRMLGSDDLLALVVSDNPGSLGFLGSVRAPGCDRVAVVPADPQTFPRRWQALRSVDLVILDGPGDEYTPVQHKALRRWVAAGGTVLVTARALTQSKGDGTWGLVRGARHAMVARDIPAPALWPWLGKYARHMRYAPSIFLVVPEAQRLLSAGSRVLIAASDVGAGRVITLGFDWFGMKMKDPVFVDGARQELWSRLVALRRPPLFSRPGTGSVTPPEARAGFLAGYIALFMLVYVILLGPVNWLALRALKKIEYGIVTVPLGALLFSVAAFCLGAALRSRSTIQHETEVLYGYRCDEGLVLGAVGILAPDGRPYSMHIPDSLGGMDFAQGVPAYAPRPRHKDLPVYSTTPTARIRNVKIGTWSMRYFDAWKMTRLGGMLTSTMTVSERGLTASLQNNMEFTLHDAFLLWRWNRVRVGELVPGSRTDVFLPLSPADRRIFPRCRNCGRYHGKDMSYSERYCRRAPFPADLRELVNDLDLHRIYDRPVLVGWQRTPGPYVALDRDSVVSRRRRLCVFPLDVAGTSGDIVLPEGLVRGRSTSDSREGFAFLSDVHIDEMAHASGSGRPRYEASGGPSCCGREAGTGRSEADRYRICREYRLPCPAGKLTTTALTVHWDPGETDPDLEPLAGILQAWEWRSTNWVDLATAVSGEQEVSVPDPGRFVSSTDACIRLSIVPADLNRKQLCSLNFLEIRYRGRDPAGRQADAVE